MSVAMRSVRINSRAVLESRPRVELNFRPSVSDEMRDRQRRTKLVPSTYTAPHRQSLRNRHPFFLTATDTPDNSIADERVLHMLQAQDTCQSFSHPFYVFFS